MSFIASKLLDPEHFDYNSYTDESNIIFDLLDEILNLSKTFDYKNIAILLIEIIETANFFKHIDENDESSEGYSIVDNTFMLSIIRDCDEFKNLEFFMKNYNDDFVRKCETLHEKIKGLDKWFTDYNKLIINDYMKKSELILYKFKDIETNLNNSKGNLKPIEEGKVDFNIRLITKNDIICMISHKYFKSFLYKNLHVINKDYYSATKDDIKAFVKILYTLYLSVCIHFDSIRKASKIEDHVISTIITSINRQKLLCENLREEAAQEEPQEEPAVPTATPLLPPPP
uniref:Uncharacterized protein n=1 Tax=viral metagenome TaxID=1070528 RepID=A0A6C0LAH3_9ZZZZ